MRPPLILASAALLLLSAGVPVHAQSLRNQLAQLFTFGDREVPLRVATLADPLNPSFGFAVNSSYEPAAAQANATILAFLTNWVSGNVANIPIGTTSGGVTFRFEGGVPVASSVSPGPISGERVGTLGKGRVLVGANYTGLQFTTIRGVPLDDLRLNFTRGDAGFGNVPAQSDIIQVRLGLDLDLAVTSFFLTYGLGDRVDVGVVLPIVHSELQGSSRAQVIPFGSLAAGRVTTFLGGTVDNPVLSTTQSVSGSATGVGDVAARVKIDLTDDGRSGVAVLGDVRFPTGDEDDLLGTGELSARGVGVFSARLGRFSPHANLGYLYWAGNNVNDAVLANVGFDQVLAPWATFAASLAAELQVGESVYQLPEPVTIREPFPQTIQPAEIPDMRDNALATTLGFKFTAASGLTTVVNAWIPVTRGGPRPDFAWTAGLEYAF